MFASCMWAIYWREVQMLQMRRIQRRLGNDNRLCFPLQAWGHLRELLFWKQVTMGGAKRGRKKQRDEPPYFRLARDLLFECNEWKKLTPFAKLLYLHIKAKYNGSNDGKIRLSYSELEGSLGLSSPSTISKAKEELIQKEWIRISRHGGMYRFFNLYSLTWKYDCLSWLLERLIISLLFSFPLRI